MNETDSKILGLLRENARISITEIAERIRNSRATVQKRIEYMETTGIITGYTVRIKPNVERNQIQAWMNIMVEGNKAQAVIAELRIDPAVQQLHTTNGKWDLLVEIHSDSLQNFDVILGRIRKISGIYNTETSLLLSTYKL
ncbi:Lrp/AsnC family transcriptional regulator [Acinetobacter sichuanensis]|uniref:Lrp/AsnC family transcriptional regulator n=1 Tax=Acinetobacter sichuanensis TaxID=2136183 RepID=A0A371YJD3_9GAMM|nr:MULTISPECIES: Lrp/AsnC family transcriptional regulator [Acinetobacter]MDM1248767.1 Lrp/AsnC family transcriptional regulator [Acinetobacter sp. R933-2]MDM1767974.1 Lrp/AsnC family transcriptional regulator [Acinetobacter sp. 226-4]RFC81599.1 Lrp/AsnC family transcriptional regulator [Acinetobacter sichuanensis]